MDAPPKIKAEGAVRIDVDGYAVVKEGGKWKPQHRVVMSRHLGRPLCADENVHHKNGDRADNRLANLELWSTSQPNGQRVADKLAWCREFMARYAGAGV